MECLETRQIYPSHDRFGVAVTSNLKSPHSTSSSTVSAPSFWVAHASRAADHKRFIDPKSGIRFYPVEVDGQWLALPGVTSLLGVLDTREDREFLVRWREQEIAAGRDPNAGRDRGTRVHAAIETYIRTGGPGPLSDGDLGFFRGMERHLDRFERFLWSERPLVSGWERCWSAPPGDPDRLARVISPTWGLAGTPDLIAQRRGMTVLGDYKTSTKPYYRCSGNQVPAHKAVGFKKYRKTVRQLIAYTLAIEETLPGVRVDLLQIFVALPEPGNVQSFFIQRGSVEFERELEVVKQASFRFWTEYGQGQIGQSAHAEARPAAAVA